MPIDHLWPGENVSVISQVSQMSVVMLHSSRAVSVKIVTVYKSKKVLDGIIIILFGLTRSYRTMFKSKKALVCTAKRSSRRFDRLREMLPFEPLLLIFSTERISTKRKYEDQDTTP